MVRYANPNMMPSANAPGRPKRPKEKPMKMGAGFPGGPPIKQPSVRPKPVGNSGATTRPAVPGKRPGKPMEMGRGFPGGAPLAPSKPAMPMRRAKGGMAKGMKKK